MVKGYACMTAFCQKKMYDQANGYFCDLLKNHYGCH